MCSSCTGSMSVCIIGIDDRYGSDEDKAGLLTPTPARINT